MKTRQLKEFAKRFNSVLDANDIAPKWQGRHNEVAKIFSVTSNAARKWIEGYGLPSSSRIVVICGHFKINYSWLMTGETSDSKDENNKHYIVKEDNVTHRIDQSDNFNKINLLEYNVAELLRRFAQLEKKFEQLKHASCH